MLADLKGSEARQRESRDTKVGLSLMDVVVRRAAGK